MGATKTATGGGAAAIVHGRQHADFVHAAIQEVLARAGCCGDNGDGDDALRQEEAAGACLGGGLLAGGVYGEGGTGRRRMQQLAVCDARGI